MSINSWVNMVKGKLKHWSTTNLSLVGQTLIVNQILVSPLRYFIAIWAGSQRVLGRIKALLRNSLWFALESMAIARVSWGNCTMPKSVPTRPGTAPGIVWVCLTYCWSPLARVHAPLGGQPPPGITPLPHSISLARCLARISIPCPMLCPIPYPIPFGSPPGNILKSLVN